LCWQVRQPFLDAGLEDVLRGPDEFLATRARLLKQGRASTVGLAGHRVVKRYNLRRRKLENLVKDVFRRSKARKAFRKAYHLELAGVPTARPIATADRRRAGVLLRCYLVMEAIPGAVDLGHWPGDPRHAARSAAGLIARLHNEGFSHRDLKESNLVFDANGKLFLIDLDGLTFLKEVPIRRAAMDLARLAEAASNLSHGGRRERLLFIRTYCVARGLRPHALKSA
jgi:tRNA A-37 threonylcarbamoyl transferase component Bud32